MYISNLKAEKEALNRRLLEQYPPTPPKGWMSNWTAPTLTPDQSHYLYLAAASLGIGIVTGTVYYNWDTLLPIIKGSTAIIPAGIAATYSLISTGINHIGTGISTIVNFKNILTFFGGSSASIPDDESDITDIELKGDRTGPTPLNEDYINKIQGTRGQIATDQIEKLRSYGRPTLTKPSDLEINTIINKPSISEGEIAPPSPTESETSDASNKTVTKKQPTLTNLDKLEFKNPFQSEPTTPSSPIIDKIKDSGQVLSQILNF